MNEVLLALLGSVAGALLGSLTTVVLFGGRLVRIETQMENVLREQGEVKGKAEKASTDANRTWQAIRGIEGMNAGRTGEVPKWSPRTTGEGERV